MFAAFAINTGRIEMPLTIIDTDIFIDAGRGVSEAVVYLKKRESSSDLAISVVTQMELTVGCRN